jgi:hypothetical protein
LDFHPQSLSKRNVRLVRLLARVPAGIERNDHTDVDGTAVFRHACAMGLEGIVSKRVAAPYRSWPFAGLDQGYDPDSPAMVRHREGRWLALPESGTVPLELGSISFPTVAGVPLNGRI